jgi:photosynthetic reaction center cytochrome c subunit
MRAGQTKTLLAVCGLILSGVLALVGAHAQSAPQASAPSAAAIPLAEQQFKNIQTLKGIPADQLTPTMQFISASLGVDCEYCHVRGAFEKDDKKPKVTAREMIVMMMPINKDNFKGHREVTCYSCHRGAADPVGTPIISLDEPKTETASLHEGEDKSTLPTVEQLLDKYLAAVGGADALHKITSRVQKGKLTGFGDQPLAIDVYVKAPDKRISFMHLKSGDSITAFDGKQGWTSVPNRVHMMSAAENDAARIDADLYFPVDIKTLYQRYTVEPGEKLDGRDTYLVIGRSESKPPLRLYFDRQSGLLLRLVRYAETPLGRNPTQIDYADYRDTDGVKIPFRWTLARPGNHFTIQVDQAEQNVSVDDGKFTPPPPHPSGAQPPAH